MSLALLMPAPAFRPGPNGLSRAEVKDIQRSRILAATLDAVQDVGYRGLSVAQITARARVSRRTFYDVFCDRDDCFLAVFEYLLGHARTRALTAYAAESSWRAGMRAAIAALLDAIDDQPALARIWVVEALGANVAVLARRAEVLAELSRAIDHGRTAPGAFDSPLLIAEAIAGGIFAVIHTRLSDPDAGAVGELLGPFMSMIVGPYLGSVAAREELGAERSARVCVRTPRERDADPFGGVQMRLTYRTARVIGSIARSPGANNREVALDAGVNDAGQISKLLNRLARLEIVENRGGGQRKGAANEWHLTERGVQIERATQLR